MENTILSFDKMQQIKPCSRNNEMLLKQLIKETEEFKLQKTLGCEIYNKIKESVDNDDISDELQDILEGGLYKFIAYSVYARYIQESMLQDTFTGMVSKQREDSQTASTGQLKNVANEYTNMADFAYNQVKCKIDRLYGCNSNKSPQQNNFSEIIGLRRDNNCNRGIEIKYL